jgi:hypothetical protein
MNLILAALCATILLKSSLLRRRASFAPVVAVASMAIVMATYMSLSNMIGSLSGFVLLACGLVILFGLIMMQLSRK